MLAQRGQQVFGLAPGADFRRNLAPELSQTGQDFLQNGKRGTMFSRSPSIARASLFSFQESETDGKPN